MTPEELEILIARAESHKLAKAVEEMKEKDRKKLSKTASILFKETEKAYFKTEFVSNKIVYGKVERFKKWTKGLNKITLDDQYGTACLAVFSLCPFSITRKIDGCFQAENLFGKVLIDRKPKWLSDWVEERLKGEFPTIHWDTIREFIDAGIIKKPQSEGYIRRFVWDFPMQPYTKEEKKTFIPLSEKFKLKPDLFEEEIWRLFEIETSAFVQDWYDIKSHELGNYETWTDALCKLANEGVIDRSRLLESSLSGLTTGFKNNYLTGYMNIHDRLKPSLDEIKASEFSLLDLLSNPASHVVTFALKNLKVLEKGNQLDGKAFLEYASVVLTMQTKSQPLTALKIVKGIVKRNPEMKAIAKGVVIDGLIHPSPDIQEFIINLLEEWLDENDANVISQITELLDDVSDSQRHRLEQLISKFRDDSVIGDNETGKVDLKVWRDDLLQRASKIPEQFRWTTGLDEALEALDNNRVAPIFLDVYEAPVLSLMDPLEPITDVEQLIDTVSHAVETVDSADDVERILDGVSRLCDQRPENFDRLTEPLHKRIYEGGGSEGSRGLISGLGSPLLLERLLLTWLRPKEKIEISPEYKKYYNEQHEQLKWERNNGLFSFISARLDEIIKRLVSQKTSPLLAVPTHKGGWIDPIILIKRVVELQSLKIDIPDHDFIQALLRLAPENRKEALSKARNIKGDPGRVIRWALGDDIPLTKKDKRKISWWLPAAWVRKPSVKLDSLSILKFKTLGPDDFEKATYQWKAHKRKYYDEFNKKTYYYSQITIKPKPEVKAKKVPSDRPLVLFHSYEQKLYYDRYPQWLIQWISMISPLNTESFFVIGIKELVGRIDENATNLDASFAYLEPLFEPYRPFTEMGCLALWLAMAGRDADVRGYSIDLFSEAILDGRAQPDMLGDVLIKLSEGGWLKLNRLAETLSEVARFSPLHLYVVMQIMQRWLSVQEKLPRDGHYVLSLINELVNRLGMPLDDQSKKLLSQIKGSSKTAKLARSLLSYKPRSVSEEPLKAMLHQLESRIERAERLKNAY